MARGEAMWRETMCNDPYWNSSILWTTRAVRLLCSRFWWIQAFTASKPKPTTFGASFLAFVSIHFRFNSIQSSRTTLVPIDIHSTLNHWLRWPWLLRPHFYLEKIFNVAMSMRAPYRAHHKTISARVELARLDQTQTRVHRRRQRKHCVPKSTFTVNLKAS